MTILEIENLIASALDQKKQELGYETQLSDAQISNTCNTISSVLTSVSETHVYTSILKEHNN